MPTEQPSNSFAEVPGLTTATRASEVIRPPLSATGSPPAVGNDLRMLSFGRTDATSTSSTGLVANTEANDSGPASGAAGTSQ